MRLIFDHSAGAQAVNVTCLTCNRTVRLADALIDPNGPRFQAYYHRACTPEGSKIDSGTCRRNGCKREHGAQAVTDSSR